MDKATSNGGRIAIDYTINYPHRVDGLILIGSGVSGRGTSGSEEDKLWQELDRSMAPQEGLLKQGRLNESAEIDVNTWASAQNPQSRQRVMTIAVDNAQAQIDNPWKYQVHPSPPGYKRLTEITIPTLVIVGDRDQPGMLLIAEDLHSKIPGSKKVVVEGADHIVNMSKPEVFDKTALEFLSSMSKARDKLLA